MKALSVSYLRECFRLLENGDLFWKVRPRNHFSTNRSHSVWNARFAGKKCGCPDGRGYLVTGLDNSLWSNHRIVFAMTHGWWPDEVDHFDQNKMNNAPSNLRAANRPLNARNNSLRSDSSTGVTGVDLLGNGSFRARITYDKHTVTLGCFSTLEQATLARKQASAHMGFSPNHGKQK